MRQHQNSLWTQGEQNMHSIHEQGLPTRAHPPILPVQHGERPLTQEQEGWLGDISTAKAPAGVHKPLRGTRAVHRTEKQTTDLKNICKASKTFQRDFKIQIQNSLSP